MKTVLIVVASIALCACGQKNTPAPAEAAQKPKDKDNAGIITLDQTAQQKGPYRRRDGHGEGDRRERDRAGTADRQRGPDVARGRGRQRQG